MRRNGILMHISSLPSTSNGIGTMGREAYKFVDFLKKSGVKCWQLLPISPTSYGDSPYSSFSAFAGNPYFIDFDILTREGLLRKSDYSSIKWGDSPLSVNYGILYENVFKVLYIAFKEFKKTIDKDFVEFTENNGWWLDNYALFMALKDKNDGKPWSEWNNSLKSFNATAIAKATTVLSDKVEFYKFIQYKFFAQYFKLKKYANKKGIEIIGDIPIYCAYDSVDVWSNQELFQLTSDGTPIDVAGCPPDFFSEDGQLWGNPLYKWEQHSDTNYEWWIKRLAAAAKIYDIVRIDHFRGFESYYSIPFGNVNAKIGEWRKGPGISLFKAVEKSLGKLNIIAEDLGFITPEVRELLDATGFPGMKILQFAFDSNSSNEFLPHNYKTTNSVVYTGTHDNETTAGWSISQPKKTINFCKKYLGVKKRSQIPWAMIRNCWGSVADLSIAQMQDFLELDNNSRMNTPSTLGENWKYHAIKEDFSDKLALKIKKLNKIYLR